MQATYVIRSDGEARHVLHVLGDRFRTRSESRRPRRIVFYDTFDWRLHEDGGELCARPAGGDWLLAWASRDGTTRHQAVVAIPPAFAWDLPDGGFRDALAQVIEFRRLLPVVAVEIGGTALRVLDDDEKTVVRIELQEGTAALPDGRGTPGDFPRRIRLIEVKGYPDANAEVSRVLEDELGLPRDDAGTLSLALETIGVRAGTYSSKLALHLDPGDRAEAGARSVLHTLLKTIVANEEGMCADLDSEFLHDFRVAVRRTRTALAQLKEVFPSEIVERFRAEFAWLGDLTGGARDLDVYILRMREYEREFPPAVMRDLEPLVHFLRKRKGAEYARLVAALRSQRYRDLIESWRVFLVERTAPAKRAAPAKLTTPAERAAPAGGANASEWPPAAALPITEVAGERIAQRFERVLSRGRKLDATSPAKSLHRMRIDCKKLRYLLEFFRSLYPPDDVGEVVKELKQLQDNLGEINDLYIQQTSLVEFAREMFTDGTATAETIVAMGRLVERLYTKRAAELARFEECFTRFAGPENRQRMARILPATGPSTM